MFLLGLCLGSFAYAMTLRMFDGRDWVNGRSECENCKHVLAWYDLFPLFSWLSTVGKCRYCNKKLGSSYVYAELMGGLLLALSYLFWPYGFSIWGIMQFIVWSIIITCLLSLIIFDLKWFILPDKIVVFLIVVATLMQTYIMAYEQSLSRLPGIGLGIAVGSGVFWLLYILSRGRYIGGGDVKFGLFFGILVGSGFKSLLIISIGSLLGTLVMLPALAVRKKKMTSLIPFGPFLILATIIVYIWGDKIVNFLNTTYLFP